MVAWKGLLRKEWKLARVNVLIGFVILIVVPLFIYTVSRYLGDPAFFSSLMIGFVFAHIFYLPALFLAALNKEGSTQLWLYNPNSMTKMIFAKFVPSFVTFFISFTLTIMITLFITLSLDSFFMKDISLSYETLLAISSISIFSIMIGAVFLSLWVLFLWTIYHSLARFQFLKKIRWILIFVLLMVVQIFNNWFRETDFYQQMKELWVIKFNGLYFQSEAGNQSFQFQIGPTGATGLADMMEISVINVIIQLLVALFMFYFSVWLLERKVEV